MGGLQLDHITAVPPWASFFSLAAWHALLVAMEDDLAARRIMARYAGDHFTVALPDGRMGRFAIVNLAERCQTVPVEDFPRMAREHFDRVVGPLPAMSDDPGSPEEFDRVAPSLIAHVYRDEMVAKTRHTLIERPLCPGLLTALAIDFGHCVGSLARSVSSVWGRSDDELFRVGLRNIQKRPVTRESLPIPGLSGLMLMAEDYTVTSQIHFLGNHLGRHYPAGALVALPTRNLLLCVALQTCDALRSVERIAETVEFVHDLFEDFASRACNIEQMFSPDLYWWRDGAVKALPAAMSPRGPIIAPPEDFIEAVLSQRSVIDA